MLVYKSSTALKPGKEYPGAKKPIVDKPVPPRRPVTPGNKGTTTQGFSALTSGGIAVYTSTQAAQSFDTDLFTGTGQTEIPILVPPGAAGVAPKVVLRYNSEDADIYIDWNEQGPGPDVGGYIVREPGPVEWPAVEDRFKLIFGGASHDLVLVDAGNNIYHTKDEAFLEAKYYPSEDYWTLKTKDGTVHRFGYGASHSTKARSLRPDLTTAYTARYMLDEVTTTSGVSTRYEYFKQSSIEYLHGQPYDQAIYPDKIKYAYKDGSEISPLREVIFIPSTAERTDYYDSSSQYHLAFFEKFKIEKVEVKLGGSLVRRYDFTQDQSLNGHLGLKEIRVRGTDGSSSLTPAPDYTFTYNTDNVLASVVTGIGGTTSFTYEKVTPLFNHVRAVPEPEGGWNCVGSPSVLSTFAESGCEGTVPVGLLSTPNNATIPVYNLYRSQSDGENGTSCTSGIDVSTTDPQSTECGGYLIGYMSASNTFMTVPLYNVVNMQPDGDGGWDCGSGVTLMTNGVSDCGSTLVGYLYTGTVDRPRHRVTRRTIADGRGWSATTSYKYWDPTYVTLDFYPYEREEFRGHAKVRVTDPVGNYTDTWFYQDDQKKGRAYSTETRSSSGALYTKTDNTFSATNPFTGVTFVKLDRTDNYECEGTTHCHQMAETFQYDAYGNPVQKNSLGDVLLSGDERTEITQWAVNLSKWIHRPIRTEFYGASNNLLRERWMSYDNATYGTIGDRGLLTEEESRLNGSRGHPDNPKVLHSYDVWGNKETVTDPLGCTTSTLYHAQKDVPTRVTNCLGHQSNMDYYPTTRQPLYRRDANDQYSWFTYDTLGREITVTGPLDGGSYFGTQTTGYLDWGNPNAQRMHRERTTEHGTANSLWSDERFDGLGRTYQTTQEGPDSTKAIVTSYKTFDARGLVAATAAPFFVYYSGGSDTAVWTTSLYDPIGRPTVTTFPNGTTAQKIYEHHQVTEIDPKGNVKKTFMDSHHRVSAIDEHNGSQIYSTDYDYDDANSLIKVTNHLQHKTRMAYDLLGRKTRMCDPNMGSLPSGDDCADNTQGVWKYEYDKAGKLTKQTDAKGQVLLFEYDLLGRQRFKRRDSTSGPVLVTWNYDTVKISPSPSGTDYPLGRLTEVIDAKIKTQFAYDKMGRVLQTRRQYTGSTTWHTMTQGYDALSRVTTETFPDADTVSYTYNTAGWLNAVNASSGTNYVNGITYNARGQKKSVTYGNNLVTSFNYNDPQDLPGQSSQWNLRNNNRTTSGNRQNLSYGYDGNGNVTAITDAIYSYNRTFHYDGLNRLVGPNSSCPDPFDAIGRVWKMDCGAITQAYDSALHPAAVTSTSQGKTYEYNDANGNMTRRNGVDIAWDIDNRVASVGAVLMEYDSSASGSRRPTARASRSIRSRATRSVRREPSPSTS